MKIRCPYCKSMVPLVTTDGSPAVLDFQVTCETCKQEFSVRIKQ